MKDRTAEIVAALEKEGFKGVFRNLEVKRASALPARGSHRCSHCGRIAKSDEFMLAFKDILHYLITICVDRPACQVRRRDLEAKRVATLEAVIL